MSYTKLVKKLSVAAGRDCSTLDMLTTDELDKLIQALREEIQELKEELLDILTKKLFGKDCNECVPIWKTKIHYVNPRWRELIDEHNAKYGKMPSKWDDPFYNEV